uniref:Uncharacterized protein n=1 Tax=Rhizophora mucronata TaxID=61149 RepID=A0A2P2P3Z5_RHIMU
MYGWRRKLYSGRYWALENSPGDPKFFVNSGLDSMHKGAQRSWQQCN